MIYTKDDAYELGRYLENNLAHYTVEYSALGGIEQASIIIKATDDPKETWINGIFRNSRHAMFHLTHDSKIELFAGHHSMPKFRKRKTKSTEHAAELIINYFKQLKTS